MKIIISRHPAAIEFVRAQPGWGGDDIPVLAQAGPDDIRGHEVAGNLPLHLAAQAARVWAVEFSGPPPRGTEYTLADMILAGARLRAYTVRAEGEQL